MGMDIGGGFGAGGATMGLQQLLAQRQMMRAYADQQAQREIENQARQQQLGMQSRQLDQTDQQRRDVLAENERQHNLTAKSKEFEDTMKAADVIPPGAQMPFTSPMAGRMGSIGQTNDTGVTPQAPPSSIAAPDAPTGPLAGTINNAPSPMGRLVTKLPSSKQQEFQDTSDARVEAARVAAENRTNDNEQKQKDRLAQIAAAAAGRPVPTATVQTVDDKGQPITKIVPKTAGASFAKGPSGATETRLASAQAVKQTGEDIIAQLSDPKFSSVVGPALGRANSLRDFIGNPPPEYAQLAGQIESYALASMGVHGMRSAQGAQQISHLLDQHHTPESLVAAIKGLNGFSQHFLENNGRGAPAPAAGKPSAADLIKKYGGGQ